MSICLNPKTTEELGEALSCLTAESIVLAGGTDLILRMKKTQFQPDILLCLMDVPELRHISLGPDRAVIGAMATMAQVKKAMDGLDDLQCLADAAGGVGSFTGRSSSSASRAFLIWEETSASALRDVRIGGAGAFGGD